MRKNKGQKKTNSQLRVELTKMAARLMYEENVTQYFDAKRMAAKRLLKQGGRGNFWIKDLPSNGEISEALAAMADLHEGDSRMLQLFAMRVVALDLMDSLSLFSPRLIGSVSTGRVRAGSDIDLHLFTDDVKVLEEFIRRLGWCYETSQVAIKNKSSIDVYTHLYIEHYFPVELSVYPLSDLRVRGRSSTDGKPIIRMKSSALQSLISDEHNAHWLHYIETGEIKGLP